MKRMFMGILLACVQGAPAVGLPADSQTQQSAVEDFGAEYRAGGRPRVLLFWNVSFDAQTRATEASVEVSQSARAKMVAREEAVLESSFRQSLHEVGVRLLDRSASVRFTAAERDLDGVDPKLIESYAVKGKADILLEVLMVTDFNSPLGRGFKVVATRVVTGEELTSLYTLAQPPPPPRTGRYVGTDEGFRYEPPTPWVPEVDAVGRRLAVEVMAALAHTLRATGTKPVQ